MPGSKNFKRGYREKKRTEVELLLYQMFRKPVRCTLWLIYLGAAFAENHISVDRDESDIVTFYFQAQIYLLFPEFIRTRYTTFSCKSKSRTSCISFEKGNFSCLRTLNYCCSKPFMPFCTFTSITTLWIQKSAEVHRGRRLLRASDSSILKARPCEKRPRLDVALGHDSTRETYAFTMQRQWPYNAKRKGAVNLIEVNSVQEIGNF